MVEELWKTTAEVAKDIENMESQEELGNLIDNVEITSTLDGTVKEVTVSYRTRNIRVDVELYNGAVTGYSHGRHRVPIMDEDTEELILKPLGDFYKRQFQEAK